MTTTDNASIEPTANGVAPLPRAHVKRSPLGTELKEADSKTESQQPKGGRHGRSRKDMRIERWSQPRYALDQRFVRLSLLVDQGEEAQGVRWRDSRQFHDLPRCSRT
jgi:hypothetical protein